MRLNKILAIIISCDMWLWLSGEDGRSKYDYPLYFDFGIDDMNSRCPMCEYQGNLNDCAGCEIDDCSSNCDPCFDCPLGIFNASDCANSMYYKWFSRHKKEYAYIIYKILDEALKEIGE